MSVRILRYSVNIGARNVDVELEITLPTGVVYSTIIASEATLEGAATAAGRVWDERDVATAVAGAFNSLAMTVTY